MQGIREESKIWGRGGNRGGSWLSEQYGREEDKKKKREKLG